VADNSTRVKVGTFAIRVASGKLFLPDEVGSKVENFYPTEEGTLRSVAGPLPYLPDYFSGGAIKGSTGEADVTTPSYGTIHGIFHALIGQNGERDVLLCHTGSQLWEFNGWSKSWSILIADPSVPGGATAAYADKLENTTRPQFPTQFESTSTGIVIVPQNGRAYFYDGSYIAPLGYTDRPGAPVGMGPQNRYKSSSFDGELQGQATGFTVAATLIGQTIGMGVNDAGYAHDSLPGRSSGMIDAYGHGRVGTVVNPVNWVSGYQTFEDSEKTVPNSNKIDSARADAATGGWLEAGEWRATVQWVDLWGNVSPMSGYSNEVSLNFQPSTYWRWWGYPADPFAIPAFPGEFPASYIAQADDVRKQIAWTGIDRGPERTIGRILHRTKDLKNSGTTDLFRLTQDSLSSGIAFATLPDNVTTTYPDNIPDAWLLTPAMDVVPVPQFKLCRVAYGRLWIANTANAPGLVRPSLKSRWGSFPVNQEIFPDPNGDEITGLWRSPAGLLTFTAKSSYLIYPSDGGVGFQSVTLSSEHGCVAPSSLATLKDGTVIWLGEDGFYSFAAQESYARGVTLISTDIELFVRRVTRSRRKQATAAVDPDTGEYRCWVSLDGNRDNNICFIFDGQGWRTRTDVNASAACVTRDHRNYMLATGFVGVIAGVWVLDHEQPKFQPKVLLNRESVVETAWLSTAASQEKRTAYTLYLWFRESENSTVTIQSFRDWRNTVVETTSASRYSGDDIPPFWGSTALGSTATWKKRRPYWTRAAVYVPSAEVFKFKLSGTGDWEFVGIQLDEAPRYAGGARIPP